jgi:hypothetical protein
MLTSLFCVDIAKHVVDILRGCLAGIPLLKNYDTAIYHFLEEKEAVSRI